MNSSNWITTHSGGQFHFPPTSESTILIEDIAHALSQICRFVGHTRKFYSVAQHSVLVSYNVPEEYALEGLLHDAPEAFIGDVSHPLKCLLPQYKEMEKLCEAAVRKTFGLPEHETPCIKTADMRMLATERRDLIINDGTEWSCLLGHEPYEFEIRAISPEFAENMFMYRFNELTGVALRERKPD